MEILRYAQDDILTPGIVIPNVMGDLSNEALHLHMEILRYAQDDETLCVIQKLFVPV
ncbi:hypothetical protein [Legionella quateirensis]|uniref:hypothetical protein n=1 Tax=Legionella quateirensis TaxID=45072 RepID=UPI000B226807|nr:hypothetical protein [Legionella quateirensis]